MNVPVPVQVEAPWVPEAWALAGTLLTVLATLAGAWVGAWWQHKGTVKSLRHAASEADRHREHADRTWDRDEARQEAERLWNERKVAHAACVAALSNLAEWRLGDARSSSVIYAEAVTATAVVRLLSPGNSGDAAEKARKAIGEAVAQRRKGLTVGDDTIDDLRAAFDRYIAAARAELNARAGAGLDGAASQDAAHD